MRVSEVELCEWWFMGDGGRGFRVMLCVVGEGDLCVMGIGLGGSFFLQVGDGG